MKKIMRMMIHFPVTVLLFQICGCFVVTGAWTPQNFMESSSKQQQFFGDSPWTPPRIGTQSTPPLPPSPPDNVKILILPGFGNDREDYFLKQAPEGSLVRSLQSRGWRYTEKPVGTPSSTSSSRKDDATNNNDNDSNDLTPPVDDGGNQIRVLPVSRSDWIQVFSQGVWDLEFWKGQSPANGKAFGWYLDLIAREIQDLCPDGHDRVVLLGHSAGGWLARAALGYCGTTTTTTTDDDAAASSDDDNDSLSAVKPSTITSRQTTTFPLNKVLGLVTLGTPHIPPPPPVEDATRGALRLTNELFPGNYHASVSSPSAASKKDAKGDDQDDSGNGGLFYITVMGEAVEGVDPQESKGASGFAHDSYYRCCGKGTTMGDGVVPVCVGHLDGAIQLNLPGVMHSINAPDSWYGSIHVLDSWHTQMMNCIYDSANLPTAASSRQWIPQLFTGQ